MSSRKTRFDTRQIRWRPKTRDRCRRILDRDVPPYFGTQPIGRIKASAIERYIGTLTVAPATQATYVRLLSRILGFALKDGPGVLGTNYWGTGPGLRGNAATETASRERRAVEARAAYTVRIRGQGTAWRGARMKERQCSRRARTVSRLM